MHPSACDEREDGLPPLYDSESFEELDLYYDEENDTICQSPPETEWDEGPFPDSC